MKYGLLMGLIFGLCISAFVFSTAILFDYAGYGVIYGLYAGAGSVLCIFYLPGKLATPLIHRAIDAKTSFLSIVIPMTLTLIAHIGLTAYICRTYLWHDVKDIPTSQVVLVAVAGFLGFAVCGLIVRHLVRKEDKKAEGL